MADYQSNSCVPYYRPGQDVTVQATAAITGKRFVQITADRQAGPLLNTSSTGGNIMAGLPSASGAAGAAKACFGVASADCAVGDKVTTIRRGAIAPVTAAGTIVAGAQVEVAADGRVVTLAAGIAVGMCVSGATSGNDAQIDIY